MKGKKFDAHKKHFEKKEIELRQAMRENNLKLAVVEKYNSELVKENLDLKLELADLESRYNKLLEYSKLSEEDIANALKRDKVIVNGMGLPISTLVKSVFQSADFDFMQNSPRIDFIKK